MMQGEVTRLADEATSKYTHFVLAATGAAIGYTLDKSVPPAASPTFCFFLLSVIAWDMSFYHGCRSIQSSITCNNLLANAEQLQETKELAANRLPPKIVDNIEAQYTDVIYKINHALEKIGQSEDFHLNAQFRFLM